MRQAETAMSLLRTKPAVKGKVEGMSFRLTKQNDVLAALVVAEEHAADNEMLKSAIDNFVMVAKLTDADGFNLAKEGFRNEPSVLFTTPNRVIDTFFAMIGPGLSRPKGILGRIFGR